uniref:Uncharacterized protein n=1 Tax=Rhabditophanes sp. KR3021 TaxID=114890 RepID=A0AC35TJB3_9BILA
MEQENDNKLVKRGTKKISREKNRRSLEAGQQKVITYNDDLANTRSINYSTAESLMPTEGGSEMPGLVKAIESHCEGVKQAVPEAHESVGFT